MHNLTTRTNASSLPPESTLGKKVKTNNVKIVEVFCRFRPIGAGDRPSPFYNIDAEASCVDLNAPDEVLKKNQGIKKYRFTRVFPAEADQETVYGGTVADMVQALLVSRKNGLVYSYGVTNAGKTHTIMGDKLNPGVLPRILERLMTVKIAVETKEFPAELGLSPEEQSAFRTASGLEIEFECFEIYNDDIFDLMTEAKKGPNGKPLGERPKLKLREIKDKKIIIEDLCKVKLPSLAEAQETISRCLKNRQVANTLLNSASSRSHTVFRATVSLEYQSPSHQKVLDLLGCICVVDLAGSERAKRTETADDRMKEACGINGSLLVLGRCLQALKKGQTVPFRDCKLTRFLADYFTSDCSMKMITNINPREEDFEESLRVLNYSSVAKETKIIVSEFRATRLSTSIKPSKMSLESLPSLVAETSRENQVVSRRSGEDKPQSQNRWSEKKRADNGHCTCKSGYKRMEDRINMLESHIDQQMVKLREYMFQLLGGSGQTAGGYMARENTWIRQFKPSLSQNTVENEIEVEPPRVKKNNHHSSDRVMKRASNPLPAARTPLLKRSNSDDKKNFETRGIRRLRLKKSSKGKNDNQGSTKGTERRTREERGEEVSMMSEKAKRSSFYSSLMHQPSLSTQTVQAISRREFERERQKKYAFMLDLCGNNRQEAELFYRQEYNETPPKLTSLADGTEDTRINYCWYSQFE